MRTLTGKRPLRRQSERAERKAVGSADDLGKVFSAVLAGNLSKRLAGCSRHLVCPCSWIDKQLHRERR